MALPPAERLAKAEFSKKKFTTDDLLDHLSEKVSSIHFSREADAPKVTARFKNSNIEIAAGGATVQEALAWLIVSTYEHEHPTP